MRKIAVLAFVFVTLPVPASAASPFVAEEITTSNASQRLFGGSDPAGGIGDFYLTNGVVEAVIDGAGDQGDLVSLGVHVPKQNSAAPTGGYLVDLARRGKHNDQLSQVLLVVGIDFNQIPRYERVEASVQTDAAVVRSIGTVPFDADGPGPGGATQLGIVTEYLARGVRPSLTLRTTITNPGPQPVPLADVLDASIWAGKGPLPFTPLPGKGFHHHTLPDFSQPQNLVPAFEVAPYVVAVGMLDERDGPMDDAAERPSGGACYGFVSGGATLDPDGEGPLPAAPAVGSPLLFGLNNTLTTAVGFAGPNVIPPGGSFSYSREIFVGTRSDAAACTDMIFDHFGVSTVEAAGRVVDGSGNGVDASLVISPVNPLPIPGLMPGAPLTQVRTAVDGSFSLRLPAGSYQARATASERPAVEGSLVVGLAGVAQLSLSPMSEVAKIDLDVTVDGDRAPSTVSFLPEGDDAPRIGKRFDVFTFDTSRPGACAAATAKSCTSDGECADAGPCIRVCSLDPERRCSSDVDCMPGRCVAAIDEHPETLGGGNAQGNVVHTTDGKARVEIRPGAYRVVANRGLEYTVDEKAVSTAAGAPSTVALSIHSVAGLDTSDMLSADFHIHSGRSFDSSAPLEGRVVSFAAEGVEIMVSSEHDFHLDYSPIIASLGLESWITSIPGDEVTTGTVPTVGNEFKFGHLNGFPVPVLPTARRRGAIEDEFVSPNWIYTRLRAQGAKVVQINHPRAPTQAGGTGIGWFNNAGFDPTRPVEDSANAFLLDKRVAPGFDAVNPDFSNIDFDTLEVANAARPADFLAYRTVRRDWMSLLLQGYFKPATGVSDSHRLTIETPGYARTLVLGVGDDPAALDRDHFVDAVKKGRMLVTTGPIIHASVRNDSGGEAGIGETLSTSSGDVTLALRIEAAPWVPVEEVRVVVNGLVEHCARRADDLGSCAGTLAEGGTLRYDTEVSLPLSEDSFIVVEAGPKLPADPRLVPAPSGKAGENEPAYSEVVPGAIAFGFTNPIFVNLGDSAFTPPGLPDCANEPLSVICEVSPSLESDSRHEPEAEFLTQIRIPDQILRSLGSRR